MNKLSLSALLLSATAACGGAQPATTRTTEPARDQTHVEVVKTELAPTAEPAASDAGAAAQGRAQDELGRERAQMLAEHERELTRLSPELRAQARALADKRYTNLRAALTPMLKSPHRAPGHSERDAQRHPVETLEFLGVTPKQTVLEYGPGEGWYTELLAPLLAKQGKLLATNPDPNGPAEQRATFYGQRFKLFLERLPEAYGKVETLTVDGTKPSLPVTTPVDTVLVFRALHGMVNQGTLQAWLAAFHGALKDNGVLGIEQHRAAADADPNVSAKQGYLPEAWVIAEVEKAGFKLAKKSEINANPKDTKDHPNGVWDLPPSYRQGVVEREKFAAIGESDRMTLRFSKLKQPPAQATSASAPPTSAASPAR